MPPNSETKGLGSMIGSPWRLLRSTTTSSLDQRLSSLVLVHGAHPARELVLVDQKAPGVGLQDRDEGLYGGVGGDRADHGGGLGLFWGGLAGLGRITPLHLPLAELALVVLLVLRVGPALPALPVEDRLLGDLGRRRLHGTGRGDDRDKKGRPLSPAAFDLYHATGADRGGEPREHG